MKTAMQIDDLHILGSSLQEFLHSALPDTEPISVQCVIKDGALMILGQHAANFIPDTQKTFRVLEKFIQAEQPPFSDDIKLYLRVEGEKRPYAFHRFILDPQAEKTYPFQLLQSNASKIDNENHKNGDLENPFKWSEIPEAQIQSIEVEPEIPAPRVESVDFREFMFSQPTPAELPPPSITSVVTELQPTTPAPRNLDSSAANSPDFNLHPSYPADLNSTPDLSPINEYVDNHTSVDSIPSDTELKSRSKLLLIGGIGMAIACFVGSIYALTRPCVLGSCQTINNAPQLNQKLIKISQQPSSGKEILDAEKKLQDTINNLKSIPVWATNYNESQKLLKVYNQKLVILQQIIAALNKGNLAAQKSRNSPHFTPTWLEIQKLWRDTILELEQVPKNNEFYPLILRKQREYRANLIIVNNRLTEQQLSQKNLDSAKEAAKMAEARSGVAQSLESWQLVYNSWQIAIKKLMAISPSTTNYQEAQQLLKEYQTKIAMVGDHTTQERFALNAYKQSILIAQQAKIFQAKNQWSQAISNWRNALNYARQVPNGSFYYNKTQPLINSYTDAINQAATQLQLAVVAEKARIPLEQTCAGKPLICTYTIAIDVIKVRLTPAYMKMVEQTALKAKIKGDYNTQAGVFNHVSTLGEALKAISNNNHIRLEIYTPDGVLRETHIPGR